MRTTGRGFRWPRSHPAPDGAEVRRAVPHERQARQERRGRRRGDLRGGRPPPHALRADQDGEQQSLLRAPRAPGLRRGAHRHINRIRGLLSEFGIVLPLKAATCAAVPTHIGRAALAQRAIRDLLAQWKLLDGRIDEYETRQDGGPRRRRHGVYESARVGPIGASAIVATVGSAPAPTVGSSPPGGHGARRQLRRQCRRPRSTRPAKRMPATPPTDSGRAVLAAAAGRTYQFRAMTLQSE